MRNWNTAFQMYCCGLESRGLHPVGNRSIDFAKISLWASGMPACLHHLNEWGQFLNTNLVLGIVRLVALSEQVHMKIILVNAMH